jgi:hypothetical protein
MALAGVAEAQAVLEKMLPAGTERLEGLVLQIQLPELPACRLIFLAAVVVAVILQA